MRMRWSAGVGFGLVVAVGVVAASTSALASTTGTTASCDKRRGYSASSKPPQFYDYVTTVAGAKQHVQQSSGIGRVLLPTFAYTDATVWIRFDTYPGAGWAVNLAHHAACTATGDKQHDWGFIGWHVSTERRLVTTPPSPSQTRQKVNLGGRVVTRLKHRSPDIPSQYEFAAAGLWYQVSGRRPLSPRFTAAEHDKWVEGRIRTAPYVGG